MGPPVRNMVIIAGMVFLILVAASFTVILLQETSKSIVTVEQMVSTMHKNVTTHQTADIDMRNVDYTVKGTYVIQSIRHIDELGVRIRVGNEPYSPNNLPVLPDDIPDDPGQMPTMPDKKTDNLSFIDANADYVPQYMYNNKGQLYEVRFQLK